VMGFQIKERIKPELFIYETVALFSGLGVIKRGSDVRIMSFGTVQGMRLL